MKAKNEVKDFLIERGDLHDCKISKVTWSLESNRLEVSILDLNGNFVGLPEYSNPQPGCLIFDGIRSVQFDVAQTDGSLRIYEASVFVVEGMQVGEFLLSPAGKLTVHSTVVNIELW